MNEHSVSGRHSQVSNPGIGTPEFIVLSAALTSIVAFSIDSMLPALPAIGAEYALANENDRQFVILAFVLAFGPAQLVYGPLSDRFGRLPILLGGLFFFMLASFGAAMSSSWTMLLTMRALQGVAAAAVRITSNAIVRDCFAGREMARIMSYVFTVFMVVPILAPAFGQMITNAASWHWIFIALGGMSAIFAVWTYIRLNETLAPDNRTPLAMRDIAAAFHEIVTNRIAMGYTIAVTLFFGGLFTFIVSIQQIVEVVYGLQDWFAVVFAGNAVAMAITSIANARLVRTIGMRRISHAALLIYTVFGGILVIMALTFSPPPLIPTMVVISIIMASFGLVAGNFNAMAMEPLGHIAGSASSVLGMISFTGGAVLGGVMGQMFDGTIVPLGAAYFGFGILSVIIVLITERGRLFGTGSD